MDENIWKEKGKVTLIVMIVMTIEPDQISHTDNREQIDLVLIES